MGIEKFFLTKVVAKKETSLGKRLKNLIAKNEHKPVNAEFFNEDGTKKFSFYEWRDEGGFRQLNIRLCFKIGFEWMSPMTVMTRWSDKEEQLYGLEIEATTQDHPMPMENFFYDLHTGGLKRKAGMWSRSMILNNNEFKTAAWDLGMKKEEDLPQFIDFEKTAKSFMLQAKNLDFSNPVLYPRELLK